MVESVKERDELHRSIWSIADELRGSVDGWDFKSYVLGAMFYRYISENITNYINKIEHDAGNKDFDYASLYNYEKVKKNEQEGKDVVDETTLINKKIQEELVNSKGFFIFPSELFCNLLKRASDDEDLNITLKNIFKKIEESSFVEDGEKKLSGLFADFDVTSNKLGANNIERNKKLIKILEGVNKMDLANYQDHANDTFGDAYEYLMSMYASAAGKSGGEFYTPSQVSKLLSLIATQDNKVYSVYDPACGSGSLLLQVAKTLKNKDLKFYGQEINVTTFNLCRINMFLHDINFNNFHIAYGDTLVSPNDFEKNSFDIIVSNPPYSIKWEGSDNPTLANDERFSVAGALAPKSKADLAFVMHTLHYLSGKGTAAIVCFPGIMYRGGVEQKIRKYLINNNFVHTVIQLPDNLFFGTSIATNILVLRKNRTDGDKVLFIDASNEFIKVTNSNFLTDDNINTILNAYKDFSDKEHFSKAVSKDAIAENDYNLSVSSYVEAEDTREVINITDLNNEINEIVLKENALRTEIDKIIKEIEG